MTTDLGNGQTRAGDAVPRQSGGAHAALATAGGHWTLTAPGLAGGVALVLTCIGGRRKDAGPEAGPKSGPKAAPAAGPGAGPGNVIGAPVPGAGATPDHG